MPFALPKGFSRKYLVDDTAVGNELSAEVLALILCQVFDAPAVTSPFPLVGDVKSFRGQANPRLSPATGHCSIGVRSVFDWCSIRVRFNRAPIDARSIPNPYRINSGTGADGRKMKGSEDVGSVVVK